METDTGGGRSTCNADASSTVVRPSHAARRRTSRSESDNKSRAALTREPSATPSATSIALAPCATLLGSMIVSWSRRRADVRKYSLTTLWATPKNHGSGSSWRCGGIVSRVCQTRVIISDSKSSTSLLGIRRRKYATTGW